MLPFEPQPEAMQLGGLDVKSGAASAMLHTLHLQHITFIFSSHSPDAGMRHDRCNITTAHRVQPPTFVKKVRKIRSWLGGGKNRTTLQPSDQALPRKTVPLFPLLWLQISCADPSHRNLSLVFKFSWQAASTAHLDSCKTIPSGSKRVQGN